MKHPRARGRLVAATTLASLPFPIVSVPTGPGQQRSGKRVFDFGTDTNTFMYLATTNSKNTGPRFRIAVQGDGDAGEEVS